MASYKHNGDLHTTEDLVGGGVAEASTLTLRPGQWPNNVYVHSGDNVAGPVVETFGNAKGKYIGGELWAVEYSGPTGVLNILND